MRRGERPLGDPLLVACGTESVGWLMQGGHLSGRALDLPAAGRAIQQCALPGFPPLDIVEDREGRRAGEGEGSPTRAAAPSHPATPPPNRNF